MGSRQGSSSVAAPTCHGFCRDKLHSDCLTTPAGPAVRPETAEVVREMSGTSNSYRPELDSLRAVAITIVLLHHYIVEHQFALRGFGVMLFFVLSSYFGTRSLLQMKEDVETGAASRRDALKIFYGRRYLRIVPVHLLVLGVTALANVDYARATFLWNAPFLANIGMLRHDEWFGRFSPLWSLAALEQFYLWWPAAVLWVPRKRLLHLVAGTVAMAVAWQMVCWQRELGDMAWTVVPFASFDVLGFGALLAIIRMEPAYAGILRVVRTAGAWPCGLILAVVVGTRLAGVRTLPYEVFWISAVGSCFFMWLIDRNLRGVGGVPGRILRNPTLAAAGRLSYSVFLVHNFVELLVPPVGVLGQVLQTDWQAIVLVPLSFALAQGLWTHVEVPLARLRRSRFQLRPAPGAMGDKLAPAQS